jgi:hypothetical protein
MYDDEAMESKNAPLFLVSKALCRSSGAGRGCDPCLRLAIGERACLCVGSGDDCCCRRDNHAGAFSFSRYGLIARREKPLPTRAPSGVRLLVAISHANILSSAPPPAPPLDRPQAEPVAWLARYADTPPRRHADGRTGAAARSPKTLWSGSISLPTRSDFQTAMKGTGCGPFAPHKRLPCTRTGSAGAVTR